MTNGAHAPNDRSEKRPVANPTGNATVTVLALAITLTIVGGIVATAATFAPVPPYVVAVAVTLFGLGALLVGGLSVREARAADASVVSVLTRASRRALGWILGWLP